jgi:ribose 5-phosphate isomerase B
MKILIASDHAGFDLKREILTHFQSTDDVHDWGPFAAASVDYPDYADKVCKTIDIGTDSSDPILKSFGILICGSGQGMSLRANKYPYIRAALVYNSEMAQLAREHNNANIICIGARFCTPVQAINWIEIFKNTAFAQGRHQTRVAKVSSSVS